mmetsp:Transcript_30383/g.88843  ORF Transcript_30383/g.88843 Transcript_30383/m.88843 type:complete len:204 (-) Transcript_30383:6052-6663(-)
MVAPYISVILWSNTSCELDAFIALRKKPLHPLVSSHSLSLAFLPLMVTWPTVGLLSIKKRIRPPAKYRSWLALMLRRLSSRASSAASPFCCSSTDCCRASSLILVDLSSASLVATSCVKSRLHSWAASSFCCNTSHRSEKVLSCPSIFLVSSLRTPFSSSSDCKRFRMKDKRPLRVSTFCSAAFRASSSRILALASSLHRTPS